jgi:hypothetical protein
MSDYCRIPFVKGDGACLCPSQIVNRINSDLFSLFSKIIFELVNFKMTFRKRNS